MKRVAVLVFGLVLSVVASGCCCGGRGGFPFGGGAAFNNSCGGGGGVAYSAPAYQPYQAAAAPSCGCAY